MTSFDLGLPRGLTLTWLGTSGFVLEYEAHTLLIDPYVSRASLRDVLFRKPLASDPALVERYVPRASAVLVGHNQVSHLSAGAYRCGAVYGMHVRVAGATFYHQGSANLIEERIPWKSVDYLLMGIAGRRFTRDYTARTLRALSPAVVLPTHYDDFFRPLDGPMGFSFNVRFEQFVDEVARVSRDFQLRTSAPLAPLVGHER